MSDNLSGEEALEWVLSKIAAVNTKQPQTTSTKKDLSSVKSKELEMWRVWKDNGQKPEHLEPLLKSFSNMINSRVSMYKNRVEIPTSTIEYEHKKEFLNALRTYDPNKGAALGTHVNNRLLKAGRYIDTNRNFARMPENIYSKIGHFNNLKSELTEKLGYEPDEHYIHDHLLTNPHDQLGRLSVKDIRRLNKEQRKAFIQTGQDPDEIAGVRALSSREDEVVRLVYYQLTPQEKEVYNYMFGFNGKPQLEPGQIAKTLKIDNSKVSKIKASIRGKVLAYLEE